MMENVPEERRVYLALKNILIGADAQIRSSAKIRKVIRKVIKENNQDTTEIASLIQEYGSHDVYAVAKTLLEQEIFESTLKAKIRFPEVFEISPAQSADRTSSEAEATTFEANAIKSATNGQSIGSSQESGQCVLPINQLPSGPAPIDHVVEPTTLSRERSLAYSEFHAPSLYPIDLPYRTQYQLLNAVQTVLEEVCYEFALKNMREEVDRRGWDCPECIELDVWIQSFKSYQSLLPKHALDQLGQSWSQLLDSVSQLRHTAVHRIRISATRLEQFLVDAEGLAHILNAHDRMESLMQIRRETQSTISELKRNKDLLESKLSARLHQISDERARLKQLEVTVTEEMLRDDKNYQIQAGDTLNHAVRSIMEARDNTKMANPKLRFEAEPTDAQAVFDEPSDSESELDLDMTNIED